MVQLRRQSRSILLFNLIFSLSICSRLQLVTTADDTTAPSKEDDQERSSETDQPAVEATPQDRFYATAMRLLASSDNRYSTNQMAFRLLHEAASLGHLEASAFSGLGKLVGWGGTFQSIGQAQTIVNQLAGENGLPFAHFLLGMLHSTGLAVNSYNASWGQALLHYTFAASGNDELANMALGYRYMSGNGVPSNCETSLIHYYQAAKSVYRQLNNRSHSGGGSTLTGPTIHRRRLMDEADSQTLFSLLLPSWMSRLWARGTSLLSLSSLTSEGPTDADHDQVQIVDEEEGTSSSFSEQLVDYFHYMATDKANGSTLAGIGQLYYHGQYGVEVDLGKAYHHFTEAAQAGSVVAKAYLGEMLMFGSEEVAANPTKALKYLHEASDAENAIGQTLLAMAYLHGRAGLEPDQMKAAELLFRAAEQGWPEAQLQLGRFFLGTIGSKADYKLALKYLQMAAQQGNILALYHLAEMNAVGTGVQRSCPSATELFKSVAERGRWSKWLMHAHTAYQNGRFDEAIVVYMLLAEAGYEVAQNNVAFMIEQGKSFVSRKPEAMQRALSFWYRSASQGSSSARVKLGDYFYYGLGTQRDFDKSVQHYKVASDMLHNSQAMFNLAYMHQQGIGMNRDFHLAKRYYDMASAASLDANFPVSLAMIRLRAYFLSDFLRTFRVGNVMMDMLSWIFVSSSSSSLPTSEGHPVSTSSMDWDFYVIPILAGLLTAIVVYIRGGAGR